ncbi:MAG TPA: DUF1800 family protein, partial [Acidimicrobiales bacterium]|nr:DUF1800 family protein [Acidimicrobiales bacterium]
MTKASDRRDLEHLLRRAGFGGRPEEVDAAVADGYEATVDRLVAGATGATRASLLPLPPLTPGPAYLALHPKPQSIYKRLSLETLALQAWWLAQMATTTEPLREKLTLLWHGHFATAVSKVVAPDFMLGQNRIFRAMGAGSFELLTSAVAEDPAMLIWLDAGSDTKGSPNENFARELMELFTLGIGNYTEADVKAGARCFTGWRLLGNASLGVKVADHDDGVKRFLGHTGNLSGADVLHIVTNHPASHRWVASRLWSHLAWPVSPRDPVVAPLARRHGEDLDIGRLVRSILMHPQFRSDRARTGLVKQPIEYVAGTLRALGVKPGTNNQV